MNPAMSALLGFCVGYGVTLALWLLIDGYKDRR